MEIDITRMGERGQVVIPQEIRKYLKLKTGTKMLIIGENGKLIFEPISQIKHNVIEKIRENLRDLKIADKRLKELERGDKVVYENKEEFLKDLAKW